MKTREKKNKQRNLRKENIDRCDSYRDI